MRPNTVTARAVAAGLAAVAAILAPSAAADADPAAAPTPSDPAAPGQLPASATAPAPAPPPPTATLLDIVAQARAINATDPTVLLGQRPDPANPDAPPLGPLSLNPLNNANLLPQNLTSRPHPVKARWLGVQPGQESENTTFRGLLSRLRNMYRRRRSGRRRPRPTAAVRTRRSTTSRHGTANPARSTGGHSTPTPIGGLNAQPTPGAANRRPSAQDYRSPSVGHETST